MNKFKVGDRVAIYGHSGNLLPVRAVGVIDSFTKENLIRIKTSHSTYRKYDSTHGGWDLTMAHPKQLRRLVKKKRECPHPHITRERLAEAWGRNIEKSGHFALVDNSCTFDNICKELGL